MKTLRFAVIGVGLALLTLPSRAQQQVGGPAPATITPAPAVFVNGTSAVPVLLPNGSQALPALAFTAEASSGLYHRSVNTLTFSILNSNFLDLNNANGYMEVGSGTNFAWSTTTDASSVRDVVLRRSAAKTLKIDTDGAAGPLSLVDVNAQEVDLMVPNNGPLKVGGNSIFQFNTRSMFASTGDKLMQVLDAAQTTGTEINNGTPTLGTCTGGTLVSGAHNFGGRVTGTTGGTCAINFGTPNFTNAPFCFAIDETAGGIVNTSGETTATFTISNITSGHAVKYHCDGRIGT